MTDRRLQEAFASEAGQRARGLITQALSRLESVAPATGDHRYNELIVELYRVQQKIAEAQKGA